MIDISSIQTYGWEAAIRGMRNSQQSWEKSDSDWEEVSLITFDGTGTMKTGEKIFRIGSKDLELASQLAANGGSHAKFRRMIGVSMEICAPLYWWKEFDTYKIGTVANSTSTMYSIMNKPFSVDQFSIHNPTSGDAAAHLIDTVEVLNEIREQYLEEKNSGLKKMLWYDVISLLPCSYNQLRTVSMNYEVVSHMVHERLHHKLDEWQEFCGKMLAYLPYAKELIFCNLPQEESND